MLSRSAFRGGGVLVLCLCLGLAGCGPGESLVKRRAGDRWSSREVVVVNGIERPSVTTWSLVESVDADGSARIRLFDEDFTATGTTLIVDSTGRLLAAYAQRLCLYERPWGYVQVPLRVGASWSLDNTRTCLPDPPQRFTGTAKAIGRATLHTALGPLEVINVEAHVESTSTDWTSVEDVTLSWSFEHGLIVKSRSEYSTADTAAGYTEIGSCVVDLMSFTAAP